MTPRLRIPRASLALLAGLCALPAAWAQEPLGRMPESGALRENDLERTAQRVDPAADGWDSEVLHGKAGKSLGLLSEVLGMGPGALRPEALAAAVDGSFACAELRPSVLETVHSAPAARVLRGAAATELGSDRGPQRLAQALAELTAVYAPSAGPKVKFKEFAVETDQAANTFRTRMYYLAYGPGQDGFVQQNATWDCAWKLDAEGAALLTGVSVSEFEEVVGPSDGSRWFEDCTGTLLAGDACYEEQVLPHLESWLGSMQASVYAGFEGHQGITVGDVNGDGRADLYVCQPGGMPNLLFVQQPDGSVREEGAARGVDFLDLAFGALLADLDGDGDQDLVATAFPSLLVLANDGQGNFELASARIQPDVYSIAAADVDLDGDLDLYTSAYKLPDGSGQAIPVPYHDANNGNPNVLLRNQGGLEFEDATVELGLDENNQRFSFAASFEDYDDDGDPDLYVANDFGRNNLYRNDEGHFTDVAGEAGVEDISAGMGISWGDYDGDGRMDLYVSNMFSSAGGRITYQRRFQDQADQDVLASMRRHARGNSLFRNMGDGTFQDVSESAGVTMGRWSWGSHFVDFDNDGREDLFVPNGFATSEQADDL